MNSIKIILIIFAILAVFPNFFAGNTTIYYSTPTALIYYSNANSQTAYYNYQSYPRPAYYPQTAYYPANYYPSGNYIPSYYFQSNSNYRPVYAPIYYNPRTIAYPAIYPAGYPAFYHNSQSPYAAYVRVEKIQ